MRIFQILEFNQFNTGSVHQMFQAATGLRERGHEVTVISRADDVLRRRCQENGIEFEPLRLRSEFDLRSVRDLRRLVRHRRPDVIHVHKGVAHAVGLAATWRNPAGAFVVNRGVSFPLDFWNRPKFRSRRVDRIVAVCEEIRKVVIASGRIDPDKVTVVYAGTEVTLFDPSRWNRQAFRGEKGIAADRFLITQVGVRDWKGWKELVDAVAELRLEHLHLALVGCRDDSERSMVMDYARARGIAAQVTAVEYRTDMPNVLASSDLVVDASWAGTGITGTIREGMAMEKPVIATDCGGNAELVSSSEVGRLIPKRDAAALAAAIRDVADHPDRARAAGRAARERVVRSFSKDSRIEKLERLYSEILERKRR